MSGTEHQQVRQLWWAGIQLCACIPCPVIGQKADAFHLIKASVRRTVCWWLLGYSNGIERTSENLWFLTVESCYCRTHSDSRLHRVAKPESAAVIVSELCAVRASDKLTLESVFVCLQAIVLFNTRYCSYIAPCGTVFEPKVSTVWQPNERYQSHSVALRGSEVNDDL